MTPTLVSRKYFIVVVRHRPEADGIGIFHNKVTAIKLRSSWCLKVKENPDIDPLENDRNRSI
jgi:hypothetical protein